MQLYFVRHAQSEGNAKGYLSTIDHDQLSPLGHAQAETLAIRLKDLVFDHIYVSSCQRTLQTIAPYLRQQNQQAEVWPDLAEACWQADTQQPIPQRTATRKRVAVPDELQKHYLIATDKCHVAWEDETFQEGALRTAAARDEILQRHSNSDDTVLVVGHFNSGTRLLELFLGLQHFCRIDHDNTGLTHLHQKKDSSFTLGFANRV